MPLSPLLDSWRPWPSQLQIFGASGHLSRPPGSTLASYTACYPEQDLENTHVKSIANMDHVWRPGQDPHHFKYYVSPAASLPSSSLT